MEIVLIVIAVFIVLLLLEKMATRFKAINWTKFFAVLVTGAILLAIIFSFTAEGVLVIVGAFIVLIVLALMFGFFTKNISSESHEDGIEKGRHEVAVNLMDILDDEAIASRTHLSVNEVRELRLKTIA